MSAGAASLTLSTSGGNFSYQFADVQAGTEFNIASDGHGGSAISLSLLAQFSASPDLQNEFVGAVIGAMASSEDLSTQILNNQELSQKLLGQLIPIIYKGLKEAG